MSVHKFKSISVLTLGSALTLSLGVGAMNQNKDQQFEKVEKQLEKNEDCECNQNQGIEKQFDKLEVKEECSKDQKFEVTEEQQKEEKEAQLEEQQAEKFFEKISKDDKAYQQMTEKVYVVVKPEVCPFEWLNNLTDSNLSHYSHNKDVTLLKFSGLNFKRWKSKRAVLKNVYFSGANFNRKGMFGKRSNFNHASLNNVLFEDSTFTHAKFYGSTMRQTHFKNVKFISRHNLNGSLIELDNGRTFKVRPAHAYYLHKAYGSKSKKSFSGSLLNLVQELETIHHDNLDW